MLLGGFSNKDSIFGIISPRLETITRLPILKPKEVIMFGFARLARFTLVPARWTGSIIAMGVYVAPHSLHSTFSMVEIAFSYLDDLFLNLQCLFLCF